MFNLYSEFMDEKILSKSYFNSVLRKSEIKKNNLVLLGDFKGLGDLNQRLGRDKVDDLLKESLQNFVTVFGEDVTSVRIGGDEFLFIIPYLEGEKPDKYLGYAEKLQENNKALPIDFVMEDVKEDIPLNNIYLELTKKLKIKKTSHILNGSNESKLKLLMDNLVNTFRLDMLENNEEYFEILEILGDKLQEEASIFEKKEVVKSNKPLEITEEEAKHYSKIHKCFTGEEKITDPDDKALIREILEELIRGANSDLYNQVYLYNYYAASTDSIKCHTLYFELVGLKACNSLYGYTKTDEYLQKFYSCINEGYNNENVFSAFELSGGKALLLLEDFNKEKTEALVDDINNNLFNDSAAKMIYASCSSRTDRVLDDLQKLENSCTEKRNEIRKNLINSSSANQVIRTTINGVLDEKVDKETSEKVLSSYIENKKLARGSIISQNQDKLVPERDDLNGNNKTKIKRITE